MSPPNLCDLLHPGLALLLPVGQLQLPGHPVHPGALLPPLLHQHLLQHPPEVEEHVDLEEEEVDL